MWEIKLCEKLEICDRKSIKNGGRTMTICDWMGSWWKMVGKSWTFAIEQHLRSNYFENKKSSGSKDGWVGGLTNGLS